MVVAEALGKRREREEEWVDDGEGMMVRKKSRKRGADGVGGQEDEKRVDVSIPEEAVEAGTKVVRKALEGVVVLRDQQDGEDG